jgi:hypothetical protein
MPPKKQPQHDQPRSGSPKPDKKGKGRSDNQDPPSPVTSGSQPKEKGCNNQDPQRQSPVASSSQSKGRAPGAPAYTPSERKAIPAPPKKKTPAEKRREPKRRMRHHAQMSSLMTLSKMPQSTKLSGCLGCRPGRVQMTWLPHQASAPVPAYHGHHAV